MTGMGLSNGRNSTNCVGCGHYTGLALADDVWPHRREDSSAHCDDSHGAFGWIEMLIGMSTKLCVNHQNTGFFAANRQRANSANAV